MEQTFWYRLGFRETTPEIEKVLEIGQNTEQKHPIYFVAPLDEEGNTLMHAVRSVQSDADGNPVGYFPNVEQAQAAVKAQIQSQMDRMQEALDSIGKDTAN